MKYLILFLIFITFLLSKELDEVTLYLKWKHQFQFAGFYIAQEKGFYKDLGLEVNIKEPTSNQNLVNSVLKEDNSFAISDSSLINNIMHGDELSLLMATFQQSPSIFLYLEDQNIKDDNSKKNRKVMLDLNEKENAFIKFYLNKNNFNNQTFSFYQTSYDVNDLINKKVDIYHAYASNEPYLLEKMNIPYKYFKPASFGMDFYGDILFTSMKNEKNNPKRVKAFFDASMKGWTYAFENIDETIELILKKYNTQNFSYDKYFFEAKRLKEFSGIDNGTFGKIELGKINHILSSYFLINDEFPLNVLNNLDIFSIVNERFFANDKSEFFSYEELNYLKDKTSITYCASKNKAPYMFYENGEYKGISIDFIKLLESKLEKKFQLINTKDLNECHEFLKEKKVDLIPLILKNDNTYEYLKASDSYIEGYLVIATKISEPYLLDMDELKNKKLGIMNSTPVVLSYVKKNFPNLNIQMIDGTFDDGLELIKKGKIYGLLGSSHVLAYSIQKKFPYELKIMKKLSDIEEGSLGIVEGNELLLSILNKIIAQIDEKELRDLKNSWTIVKEESAFNSKYIINSLFFIIILFLAFLYKQYVLNKVNQELKIKVRNEVEKNREKDKLMFQQLKLASMGEMLNNIAHQWRQPLNVINSNVAVIDSIFIKNNVKDVKLDNSLIDIESQTKFMSETIESFRTFFSPSKEHNYFLLSEAVEDVMRIIKFDFEKNGIKIRVIRQKDLNVKGFLGEYIQTIIAILNNSKDAFILNKIEKPEINIYIDEMLLIDDNAGGISEEIIDRIFEPYFTTKYKDKGTGTGLYMAKMIIENSMNGILSVSKIENGTRFKIII